MKVSDERLAAMVRAYQVAWAETPQGEPGDRTRAGLLAALEELDREERALEMFPRAIDRDGDVWHQMSPGAWTLNGDIDNDQLVTSELIRLWGRDVYPRLMGQTW